MATRIVLATEADVREALYAFRHRVYAEELGSLLPEDVRRAGRLTDAFDDHAFNYAALDGDSVVGSLRVVDLVSLDRTPTLERNYSLPLLLARLEASEICCAGRLALAPEYRRGTLLFQLIARSYEDARGRGVRVGVSDCSPHLLGLYEALGYVRFGEAFNDPVFGFKQPILWALGDLARMQAVRSPLAKTAQRFPVDEATAAWLRDRGND